MITNNDALDLLDTLSDRIDQMSPGQLKQLRERVLDFDPNKPVNHDLLEKRVRAWRQREADRLFNGAQAE